MIVIIDYGMGNLRSVQKALHRVGADAQIIANPTQLPGGSIKNVDRLILPGVGAFADCMANLTQRRWAEPIHQFIATGRPFLGICLGLQMLFDGSEEDAPSPSQLVPGLGILPGKVVRFDPRASDGSMLKVPHMGWNTIRATRSNDPLLRDLPAPVLSPDAAPGSVFDPAPSVYFVHSYFAQPSESPGQPIASGVSDYGRPFCATVWRDNVWATQFHPEKSQDVGMKILSNFASI
jgi:imidazole glycerol-phosphate synthase subunit HisH